MSGKVTAVGYSVRSDGAIAGQPVQMPGNVLIRLLYIDRAGILGCSRSVILGKSILFWEAGGYFPSNFPLLPVVSVNY